MLPDPFVALIALVLITWVVISTELDQRADRHARAMWEKNPARIPDGPDLRETWRLEYRR